MAIEAPPDMDEFSDDWCDGCGMPKNQCICDDEEDEDYEQTLGNCPDCGYPFVFCECDEDEDEEE